MAAPDGRLTVEKRLDQLENIVVKMGKKIRRLTEEKFDLEDRIQVLEESVETVTRLFKVKQSRYFTISKVSIVTIKIILI